LKKKRETKVNLIFYNTKLWITQGNNTTVQRRGKLDEQWKNCYRMEGRRGKQTSFACDGKPQD